MVTSCFRRMGNYQKALELYEKIHTEYPDNLECKPCPLAREMHCVNFILKTFVPLQAEAAREGYHVHIISPIVNFYQRFDANC